MKFWPFVLIHTFWWLEARLEIGARLCLWYRFFLLPFIRLQNTLKTASTTQLLVWLRKGWAGETSRLFILTFLFVLMDQYGFWPKWFLNACHVWRQHTSIVISQTHLGDIQNGRKRYSLEKKVLELHNRCLFICFYIRWGMVVYFIFSKI